MTHTISSVYQFIKNICLPDSHDCSILTQRMPYSATDHRF